MPHPKKVSIIIPVYNGSNYLNEAIDSALQQTYKNIEIIVINDGSNDGEKTEKIALSYANKIKYFSKKNGGVASALNYALNKMEGDYFSWLSHDDLYVKDKVEIQIDALFSSGLEKAIVYSNYALFSHNPSNATPVYLSSIPHNNFRFWLTTESALHGCTLLIPKQAFKECGKFNETLRYTQDYDLWFRMAEKYHFLHLPDILVKGRIHPEQDSTRMAAAVLNEATNLLIKFAEALVPSELPVFESKHISKTYARIAANFRKRGFKEAANYLTKKAMGKLSKDNSFYDKIFVSSILVIGFIEYYAMQYVRILFSKPLRAKIKKIISK